MENTIVEPSQEAKPNIEQVVNQLDKILEGRDGIKFSEAWKYREEIRAKYGLPECGYRWEDPIRYIEEIESFLKKNGVRVRDKHEFSNFFKENPTATALHSGPNVFRDSTVVVQSASDGEWFRLRARANQLSHESVHALQAAKYPIMPNEEAEKEAYYYQMFTPQLILQYKDDPNLLFEWINGVIERNINSSTAVDKEINGRSK